jgi:uncharacterized protein involved in response to NO
MRGMSQRVSRFVPFAYGFRPFFLAALAYGGLAIFVWMVIRSRGIAPLPGMPPQLWHAHEMLFGFIGAAIAGFLLTAVPSWTNARGFAGWPLIALFSVWLAGRAAFAFAAYLSPHWVTVVELAFLPLIAVFIALPLLRSRNRNTPLLLVLVALWLADATFLCAVATGDLPLASKSIRIGIDIVLLLITVIGGRIVPAFTASALRRHGIDGAVHDSRIVGGVAIACMIAVGVVDAVGDESHLVALIAACAAVAHVVRMSRWAGMRSLRDPIVWVLHLAYAWLPLGLALKAVRLLFAADWASGWLHALTIGAAASMVVAVISRASLGHTGRALVVTRSIAISYGALSFAALARTFAVAVPDLSEWTIRLAAVFWIAAFAIVLFVYSPILVRPRVDGRPG